MDINQNNTYGDNNVNVGSIPRSILTTMEQSFITELVNNPSNKNEITIRTYFGDAECQNLSHQIKDSFEKAGWKIREHSFVIPNKPVRNVALGVPKSEEKSKTALIIYNWLNANNLKVSAELIPDEKGYIIFAGQNI